MSKKAPLILTLVVAAAAFALGPVIWPNPADGYLPTSGQMPFFLIVAAVEALAFGIGASFIVFGWPLFKKMKAPNESALLFVSLAWILVSWWPHDNFHRFNGHDTQGLLYIEYAFHVTMILAGVIIASSFFKRWMPEHIEPKQ